MTGSIESEAQRLALAGPLAAAALGQGPRAPGGPAVPRRRLGPGAAHAAAPAPGNAPGARALE